MAKQQTQTNDRILGWPLKLDPWLLTVAAVLMCLGLVMVGSASLSIAREDTGNAFYYLQNQGLYAVVGIVAGLLVLQIPVERWHRLANPLLILAFVLLIAVLIPGIGREVKGSARWLSLGIVNVQASELIKLFMVIYFADYLARRGADVRASFKGFLKPLWVLAVVSALLLAEPDLGATAVVVGTVLAMFFIAGVRLWQFAVLLGGAIALLATMVFSVSWRFERLKSFLYACDPEFQYNQGYQLCQALIAFARGDWFGVGLGSGVQKLFYLPEAHTDFVLAVLGEELGVAGSVTVIVLFALLVYRIFAIAQRVDQAKRPFATYIAYGIGLWLGLQAFVNIAVNMGLLPTKGLTLPLMSYGGSSLVVTCIAIAILLRIEYETRGGTDTVSGRQGTWVKGY
jgi:cell division protein FtsW